MDADVASIEEMMIQGRTLHADDATKAGLATGIEQQVFAPGEPIHRFRLD
jgi:hypothetical protein